MKLPIYMDYHATTPVDPRVVDAMLPYFTQHFGNPASRNHSFGWEAEEAVETARKQVADLIGANVKEVNDNIDREELGLILRQTLGTAEAMNKRYTPNGQYMIIAFDMVPLKQPAEGRLHCQWIYDGKSNAYSVFLYQDLPTAPKRDVADNSQIKKL